MQTPPGRGGIAVITLSGPLTGRIIAGVFRPMKSHSRTSDDVLRLGRLIDGDRTIDEAVVHICGEVADINIHGGPAAATAALELLSRRGAKVTPQAACETFRPAHPKHDNPAVGKEMLESLPAARSRLVVAAITRQWSAGLSEFVWETPGTENPTREAASELRKIARGLTTMQKLLHPPEVVIAGPPNVGKSTLANALVGREVSVVHETRGTTRDWVREQALLGGVPIWLTDTAGLWEARSEIDAEAVRRARRRAEEADLVLLVEAGEKVEVPHWLHAKKLLKVSAKCDICAPKGRPDVAVSALTGEGLDDLRIAILKSLQLDDVDPVKPMAFTQRQADLLNRAADMIEAKDSKLARRILAELLAG